jgi:hypothetical protein
MHLCDLEHVFFHSFSFPNLDMCFICRFVISGQGEKKPIELYSRGTDAIGIVYCKYTQHVSVFFHSETEKNEWLGKKLKTVQYIYARVFRDFCSKFERNFLAVTREKGENITKKKK